MNLWECDEPGCKNTAIGVGGAVGLRAVGWYFQTGYTLKCPAHHPDKSRLVKFLECDVPNCNVCYAHMQAEILQAAIAPIQIREF